jgi:predicted transcriptional regulator
MKVLRIKIISREIFQKNVFELAANLNSKKTKLKSHNKIYFESIEAVRKLLTENRLDVWRVIRDKKPESISHLAELLKREFRAVHRDVMLLEELGLISLTKGPGKRGDVINLKSRYDELILAVA